MTIVTRESAKEVVPMTTGGNRQEHTPMLG
jgi:hypothetical protein